MDGAKANIWFTNTRAKLLFESILVPLAFSALLLTPAAALSDCTDLGRANHWYVLNERTIIFYVRHDPLAQVDLRSCTVNPSSRIRLLTNYVCDGDTIVVDGQECTIMTLTVTSAF